MGAKKIILIVAGSVIGVGVLGIGLVIVLLSVFGISVEEYEQKQASSTNSIVETTPVDTDSNADLSDNQKLKDSALEADFIEIYSGNYDSTDTYKVTGTVGDVGSGNLDSGDQFMLSQDEGNIDGAYAIRLMTSANLTEGDTITVYGFIEQEFAENGAPILVAVIVE